jgi:hypothetical protein
VYNVDGTLNEGGSIEEAIDLMVSFGHHRERCTFHITNLGSTDVIIGLPWLKLHNPDIDWRTGKVIMNDCPRSCGYKIKVAKKARARKRTPPPLLVEEEEQEEERDHDTWYYPGMEV